jgi:alkylation response protein AidB-like acyl-CoA dehydrogenase
MHPEPTTEQRELMEAVERFCKEEITPERLATWEREPRGVDAGFWDAAARLGWFGLGLPERAGGSGLGLVEVAALLQECSRGLVPQAVVAAIRSGWALARLDPEAPQIAEVAAGRAVVTLAFDEESNRDPSRFETRVERGSAGARVSGTKSYVPFGQRADLHVVAAREGDGISLVLVGRDGWSAEPLRTFDGEEQSVVHYSEAPVLRGLGAPGRSGAALAEVRREQTALALVEMVGGMQAVLDLTVAYVKEREQFGQKIAVFQAVQHQVADMATAYTASRHLAWQAITRLARGTLQGGELEMAAAYVGQAFKRVSLAGHHLHGGAGFVVEHPLHYYAERAQALCIRYTPEADALSSIASRLLDD